MFDTVLHSILEGDCSGQPAMSQQQQTMQQQQSQQRTGGEPQQVLHVKQDSATDMEQLFAVLQNNQSTTPTGLPFAQRKLPASFFTPPKPQHSREGSADSTHLGIPQRGPGGLQIAHGRSRSSPAMLPNTLSALSAPTQQQATHFKQQSLGDFPEDSLGPLPQGWDMAKTTDGQRYYLK